MRTSDIRKQFIDLYNSNTICENGTIEIMNASFIADEPTIFGEINYDYALSELKWYNKQSLNIFDMPCDIPQIWRDIATRDGRINSNYGWCIFSPENYLQFENAIMCLVDKPDSRQSCMIYIRPTMHYDSKKDGMKDFMCTYSVQLMIRNNKLHYLVYMRSNDAVFGYKNDKYWHDYVFNKAIEVLKDYYPNIEKGDMHWNAGSLHVYQRHFKLIGEQHV